MKITVPQDADAAWGQEAHDYKLPKDQARA